MHGKLKLRAFPKVQLTFLEPVRVSAPAEVKGAELREHLSQKLYDIMTDMVFRTSNIDQHLFHALLDARSVHGSSRRIMEDVQRNPISFNRIVIGSFILGRKLCQAQPIRENRRRSPAQCQCMCDNPLWAHGLWQNSSHAEFFGWRREHGSSLYCKPGAHDCDFQALHRAGGPGIALSVLAEKAQIIYLEDLRASLGPFEKVYGLCASRFPRYFLKFGGIDADPNSPAVILFTSGSEGVPKGVVLSHRNINANRQQIAARISFNAQDIAFNALPMFHAFGLTGGTLLPLLAGVKTVLYPSPLHYKIVPEMVYDTDYHCLWYGHVSFGLCPQCPSLRFLRRSLCRRRRGAGKDRNP